MLTRQQFVTDLTSRNRFIHLGGASHIRKQSSMIPVVNAVESYGLRPNGANLLALIQKIGNLTASTKMKYQCALTQLYTIASRILFTSRSLPVFP